jgi:hypothetical protein
MTQPDTEGQAIDDPVGSLAQSVLDTVVATFESVGIALPNRQEITVGDLVVDNEVLGVMFGGVHVGPPANEVSQPYRGNQPRTALFDIQLWRTVDTGEGGARGYTPPKTSRVISQAKTAMLDAWYLLEAAYRCDQMNVGVVATTAPLPPQGGLQGIALSMSVQVP